MDQTSTAWRDARPGEGSGPSGGTGPAEYAVGALGGLLVLALLAYLGHHALAVPDRSPELSVSPVAVEPRDDAHAVVYQLANTGGVTAEQVTVSGTLTRQGRTLDESSATFDYIPPGAARRGVLLFEVDPGTATLTLTAESYILP